tara:strand:+ start:93 stop:1130 length:1038 start_codon:yes stop_codon:yes gene_type:complete
MKIAIIGAGFFGSTIAIKLSKSHSIDLYEKQNDILNEASKINQFRFHMGFHYPRSKKTIKEIKLSYKLFINFFSKKVFEKTKNFYSVANKGSKISYRKYLNTLKKYNLKYKITSQKFEEISNLLLTNEKILNYFKFKKILKKKLKASNINLLLNREFKKHDIQKYDKIIVCCYAANNKIINYLSAKKIKKKNRYELVEKILVKLPKKYKKNSYVVIDGKFVCIDPYLGTKYHLLSDVKYSKVEVVKKKLPIFKSSKKKYLNGKIHKNIKRSNFHNFIKHSSSYLPFLKNAKFVGSMFVVRTLKENVENTDERTGDIKFIDKKLISVFSGKWNTCVYVANKLERLL